MKSKHPSVLDFWSHVKVVNPADPDSCWEWRNTLTVDGYGLYKGILARRIAAIIYYHRLPGNITTKCKNRKCVREDHFANVGWSKQDTDRLKDLPIHRRLDVIKKVLSARGKSYTVRELSRKTGESQPVVRDILRESAMYDILADVEKYLANKQTIPICPDTRFDVVK